MAVKTYNGNDLVAKMRELLKAAEIPYNRVYIEKALRHGMDYHVTVRVEQAEGISGFHVLAKVKRPFFDWLDSLRGERIGMKKTRWSCGTPHEEFIPYKVEQIQANLE